MHPPHVALSEYESRLRRTRALMGDNGLEGLAVFAGSQGRDGHIAYLTNHRMSSPNEWTHSGLGYAGMVITAAECVLVAPMEGKAPALINVSDVRTEPSLIRNLSGFLKEKRSKLRKIGVAGLDILPAEYYLQLVRGLPEMEFVEASGIMESQRKIKSEAEIEMLDRAAQCADGALLAAMNEIREGVTEQMVELAARRMAVESGADFSPSVRVSSGQRIDARVNRASIRKMQKGDFVMVSVAGSVDGYAFLSSRVRWTGPGSPEQNDYLHHLEEATEWMCEAWKPGLQKTFYATESRGRAIQADGHGIGLEIVEPPWIILKKPFQVESGMVFCVGPHVESSHFGTMCVQDMVAVTERGPQILTKCPKYFP